jgi:hypothetical protein
VTREDIHKLMGGYATGSLSEAERKVLFEAALEDQELFDELAREQALKELLDEPGAKQRLIAGLAPRRTEAAWRKLWPWLAFAGALALPLMIANFVMVRSTQRQAQLAQVRVPELRSVLPQDAVSQPVVPEGQRRAEPTAAPPPKAVQPPKKVAPGEELRDAQTAAPAVNAPELDAVRELKKDVATPPAQDSVAPAEKAEASPAAPVVAPLQAPQPRAAAPAVPPPAANAFSGVIGGVGGGGGGRGGRVQQIQQGQAGAIAARAAAPARFSFSYSVTPEGALRVQPIADGFLTVTVTTAENSQVLRSSQLTRAGSVVDIPIPAGSTQATIVYSAQNAPAATATGSLAAEDPPSGTKTDPTPSINSRLQAIIPLTPRE